MVNSSVSAKQSYVIAIMFVGFLCNAAVNLTATTTVSMSSFSEDLGFSLSTAAWIQSCYGITYMGFGILWGSLADKIGLRKQLAIAAVVAVAGFMGYAFFTQSLISCILWWALAGAGLCGLGPSVVPKLASNWFHPSHRARGYMIIAFGGTVMGFLIGIVQPAIITELGWRANYALMGGFLCVLFLIEIFLMRNHPSDVNQVAWGSPKDTPVIRIAETTMTDAEKVEKKNSARGLIAQCLRMPITWAMAAVNIFYYLTFMSNMQFLVTTLVVAGFSLAVGGLAQSFINVGRGTGTIIMPIFADKFCRKYILLIQMAFVAIMGFVVYFFLGSGVLAVIPLLVIFTVYGFGDSMLPTLGSVYTECFPPHLRGTGPGIVNACAMIGAFFGPLLAGVLASIAPQYVYALCGGSMVVCFFLTLFFMPKTGGKYGDPLAEKAREEEQALQAAS